MSLIVYDWMDGIDVDVLCFRVRRLVMSFMRHGDVTALVGSRHSSSRRDYVLVIGDTEYGVSLSNLVYDYSKQSPSGFSIIIQDVSSGYAYRYNFRIPFAWVVGWLDSDVFALYGYDESFTIDDVIDELYQFIEDYM